MLFRCKHGMRSVPGPVEGQYRTHDCSHRRRQFAIMESLQALLADTPGFLISDIPRQVIIVSIFCSTARR